MILLGKITKVHGYGGALMVKPLDYPTGRLKEREWVFIEIDGKPVPFFVSSVSEHASGNIILKFENYDSSEQMMEFAGCRIFLEGNDREQDERDEIQAHLNLAGFELYKPSNEYIGTIKKILSLPMQYMIVLEDEDNNEILIPLNEDWVREIDRDRKKIIMDLPGGIEELNA